MTGRARRWVVLVALAALLGAPSCGAGAVDRSDEVDALVATCRSIQERSTGRAAAPVDRRAIDDFLAAEPGGPGDRSVASLVRRVCAEATREDGPGGAPVTFPFPGSGP